VFLGPVVREELLKVTEKNAALLLSLFRQELKSCLRQVCVTLPSSLSSSTSFFSLQVHRTTLLLLQLSSFSRLSPLRLVLIVALGIVVFLHFLLLVLSNKSLFLSALLERHQLEESTEPLAEPIAEKAPPRGSTNEKIRWGGKSGPSASSLSLGRIGVAQVSWITYESLSSTIFVQPLPLMLPQPPVPPSLWRRALFSMNCERFFQRHWKQTRFQSLALRSTLSAARGKRGARLQSREPP
jgi:hypothetical protein